MSNAVYPALPGLAWPVPKTPEWNTIKQRAASGREVRVGLFSFPLWNLELTYNVLRSGARNGMTYNEYQTLTDFFNARGGSLDNFLFDDPSDDLVVDMQFGVGDGSTPSFQLTRTLIAAGFIEPVMNVNLITNIKDNGSVIPQGAGAGKYTINSTGLVTFGTVPTAGHVLTWTGSFYYRCRFADDLVTAEQFMYQLWRSKSVKLTGSLGVKI